MGSIENVREKFSRVQVHYEELRRELDAYYGTLPDTVYLDPATTLENPQWQFPVVGVVPAKIGLIVGDCLQTMRSSLDYLVWELVLVSGNQPNHSNAFPIALTEEGYRDDLKKRHRLDGVTNEAIAVIDALQPFNTAKTHSDFTGLVVLDKLVNINKHRRVLLTGWQVIYDLDTRLPISFKMVKTVPPATPTDDRLMAFVSIQDGPVKGMEVAAFVDALAHFVGDIVLPMFEKFFEVA